MKAFERYTFSSGELAEQDMNGNPSQHSEVGIIVPHDGDLETTREENEKFLKDIPNELLIKLSGLEADNGALTMALQIAKAISAERRNVTTVLRFMPDREFLDGNRTVLGGISVPVTKWAVRPTVPIHLRPEALKVADRYFKLWLQAVANLRSSASLMIHPHTYHPTGGTPGVSLSSPHDIQRYIEAHVSSGKELRPELSLVTHKGMMSPVCPMGIFWFYGHTYGKPYAVGHPYGGDFTGYVMTPDLEAKRGMCFEVNQAAFHSGNLEDLLARPWDVKVDEKKLYETGSKPATQVSLEFLHAA